MARELSYSESVQRSLIKTYRKSVWNPFVEACKKYGLVCDGDRIAVYMCGDAASLMTALLLLHLKRISDTDFELFYYSENPSIYDGFGLDVIRADSFDDMAKLAVNNGCNKIALSANLNDVVNRVIRNVFYASRLEGILPRESRGELEIIRPLFCVYENEIKKWADYNSIDLPINSNSDDETAKLVKRIKDVNPDVEHNVITALENVKLDTLIEYELGGNRHSFLDTY